MTQTFTYRLAQESDFASLQVILAACAEELPPLSPAGMLPLFQRNVQRGSILLALSGTQPVGVCIWSPPLRRISLLAVIPKARGKGIASILLRAAIETLPPGEVWVETYTAADPRGKAARALYQKFGFQPAGMLPDYETPMEKLKLCRD